MSHTIGPLEYRKEDSVVLRYDLDGVTVLAQLIQPDYSGNSTREKDANGKLFALSPEMLKALESLMPERTGYGQSMCWETYNRAVKTARELIKKAHESG